MSEPAMPDRISVDPDPPIQGSELSICYDFDGLTIEDVELTLSWTPPGTPTSVSIKKDAGCVKITVPANATALTIVDTSGHSAAWGGSVVPP